MLGMYKKAEETVLKGPKNSLQIRLLFHIAHKLNEEDKLMNYHQQLQDILPDQLSLASMHYMRNHYQEAIDVYKRYLLENRWVVVASLQSILLKWVGMARVQWKASKTSVKVHLFWT